MKRSQTIRLVMTGAFVGGVFAGTGCSRQEPGIVLAAENTYTNNQYVPGAGYYHAPYRAWYSHPFNFYMPGRGYYHGGGWSPEPNPSSELHSKPLPQAVESARAQQKAATRTGVTRGGFGSSSRSTGA